MQCIKPIEFLCQTGSLRASTKCEGPFPDFPVTALFLILEMGQNPLPAGLEEYPVWTSRQGENHGHAAGRNNHLPECRAGDHQDNAVKRHLEGKKGRRIDDCGLEKRVFLHAEKSEQPVTV